MKRKYPIIEKVRTYIECHYTEPFSVGTLGESMQISIFYLSRLFKREMGITMIEYRNKLRLKRAKLLLVGTDESVESVQDGMEKSYVEIHKLLRIIGGKETRFLKNYLLCWQIGDAEEAEWV